MQITDDALEAAVELSDRYITGRCLPDKAIDVIDEAGARVRLQGDDQAAGPQGARRADRAAQPGEGRGGRQPGLREGRRTCATRPTSSRRRRSTITREWREKAKETDGVVDEEVIAEVVCKMTGIPLTRLSTEDSRCGC